MLYFTVEPPHRALVLISSVLGIILHIGLELFGSFFHEDDAKSVKVKTGWAAFASLLYLEVLDASFSFDGVIGAFAITSNVVLPMAAPRPVAPRRPPTVWGPGPRRRGRFSFSLDTAFERVISSCADVPRPGASGSATAATGSPRSSPSGA